jgi:spoIIIJ-associated protein
MSNRKTTLEIIAPSVEEAVQKGLEQLGLPADAVEVDVLDAGSKGLFGLGSRQARVRLILNDEGASGEADKSDTHETSANQADDVVAGAGARKPATEKTAPVVVDEAPVPQSDLTVEELEAVRVSSKVVAELLEKMRVGAHVAASMRRAMHDEDEDTVLVNIEGDDLSILIGRKSETLNALQYIASLIVGKQLDRWTPLMIDVQGFRARRDRQLRTLARRMAEQAIATGKRQVLEPMPANERRVIHLELRGHPKVQTESIGDDPNRKITIVPKK